MVFITKHIITKYIVTEDKQIEEKKIEVTAEEMKRLSKRRQVKRYGTSRCSNIVRGGFTGDDHREWNGWHDNIMKIFERDRW